MIREYEFFHGVVLANIIHSCGKNITVRLYNGVSNSAYILNESIGLYIKYSSRRLPPWRFSFRREHQDEIKRIQEELGEVFIILVCNDDGFAALEFSELKAILNDVHEDIEWISVSRNRREMYYIKGSDGTLPFKVGVSDLSRRLLTKEANVRL